MWITRSVGVVAAAPGWRDANVTGCWCVSRVAVYFKRNVDLAFIGCIHEIKYHHWLFQFSDNTDRGDLVPERTGTPFRFFFWWPPDPHYRLALPRSPWIGCVPVLFRLRNHPCLNHKSNGGPWNIWRALASLKIFFGRSPKGPPKHLQITQYCNFRTGINIMKYSVRWQWICDDILQLKGQRRDFNQSTIEHCTHTDVHTP